jgi:hypothetical protein
VVVEEGYRSLVVVVVVWLKEMGVNGYMVVEL